jgi:YD repeat-containing protein
MDYFNTDRIVGCSPNSNAVSPYYMNPFSALRYDNMTAWVYNDTLIVKTFDKNGLNPVIDTTVSVYNNPVNRQLTQSLTSTSAGAWKSEVHKYPNDYSTIPVYASMITKNIISPVVDITTYKGSTQLGEAKINYSDWGNGNYALSSVQKSFYGGPFTTEGTIDAYNKRGNITQYTGKDLVTTAILWGGYNGQYPVAKVIGATYAGAVSHLSVADTALYGMSEADIRTQIALIRTAMPGAHVTTYTFKQKTGVSSITDERSAISTFAYDSKDRLGSIFDLNGNIVKSYTYNFGIPTPDNTSGYFGNDYVQGSFTCQVCLTGYSAQAINYGIAANSYYSGTSKAEANAAANAALAFYGQLAANQFSECVKNAPVYWNVAQTRTFIKTCPANYTGTSVDYTVPAHTYSGPTQTDADALALYHVNTEGQAYADAGTHGTCNPNCTTGNCSGVDKKCVNGACETGQKVYTSSVQDHGSLWTCTYHYHWSDGTNSGDYTETSTSQCVNMEE